MRSGFLKSNIYVGGPDPINLYKDNCVYTNVDMTIYGVSIDFVSVYRK
ncbi:MAG: hypothetical protein AB7V56_06485 [Candidatus Nitrosocosmicus sp.]